MAKLGPEVCTIQYLDLTPKTSVTSYWDGNIKWITPAELESEDTFYIMDSVLAHILKREKNKQDCLYLPTGTVIYSSVWMRRVGKTAMCRL